MLTTMPSAVMVPESRQASSCACEWDVSSFHDGEFRVSRHVGSSFGFSFFVRPEEANRRRARPTSASSSSPARCLGVSVSATGWWKRMGFRTRRTSFLKRASQRDSNGPVEVPWFYTPRRRTHVRDV
jgi:hypothetical protein